MMNSIGLTVCHSFHILRDRVFVVRIVVIIVGLVAHIQTHPSNFVCDVFTYDHSVRFYWISFHFYCILILPCVCADVKTNESFELTLRLPLVNIYLFSIIHFTHDLMRWSFLFCCLVTLFSHLNFNASISKVCVCSEWACNTVCIFHCLFVGFNK